MEDEILDFLIKLENIQKDIDSCDNDECSSSYLNFKHNDNIIDIESGWSTPEEGGTDYYKIDLLRMEYTHSESATTVYGSFENNSIIKISNLDEFIKNNFKLTI